MILFYQWNAFMQKGMEKALNNLKAGYEVYYDIADNWDEDYVRVIGALYEWRKDISYYTMLQC